MATINKPVIYSDILDLPIRCSVWGRRMPTTDAMPVALLGLFLENTSTAQADAAALASQLASANNLIITKEAQIADLSKAKQHWY